MSFLQRWFGGGGEKPAAALATREMEHKGFTIRAEPYKAEGGQFQTAGLITKTVDGTEREHRFVRADRHGSLEDALDFSLAKGRQIVDENGDRLFR